MNVLKRGFFRLGLRWRSVNIVHNNDDLDGIDEQLRETPVDSGLYPMLMAQKGRILVEEFRLNEAVATLRQAETKGADLGASIEELERELKRVGREMEEHVRFVENEQEQEREEARMRHAALDSRALVRAKAAG